MKLNECREWLGVTCSGGFRPESQITLVVDHITEGGYDEVGKDDSAENVARYLKGRPDGSVQLIVDGDSAVRIMSDRQVACGVGSPGNAFTVHIEHCGFTGTKPSVWVKAHRATIQRGAWWTAWLLVKHDIAVKFDDVSDLKQGHRHGWTWHYDVALGIGGTTHTDTLKGSAFKLHSRYVEKYAAQFKRDGLPHIEFVG